jgi:hypothetical protein
MIPEDPYTPQRQYQVVGLPSSYLVDREGTIVSVIRGALPNKATLDAELVRILDGAAEAEGAGETSPAEEAGEAAPEE